MWKPTIRVQMKEMLKKFSESTIAKLIVAAIVPGGFIVWGLYEFKKFKKSNKEHKGRQDILRDIRISDDDAKP